eukprot:scaffold165854_cov28-Tisochrysis_lutea.AAC.3
MAKALHLLNHRSAACRTTRRAISDFGGCEEKTRDEGSGPPEQRERSVGASSPAGVAGMQSS